MGLSKSVLRRLEIQSEANIKECKICKEKKLRILYGKFPSMNNKYVDEKGALWSGRTCPPCNQARIKTKMKELRAGRKVKIAPNEVDAILAESLENLKEGKAGEPIDLSSFTDEENK